MKAEAVAPQLLLAACAVAPLPCPAGTEPSTVAEAYFGRNVAGREEVSEAEWRAFWVASGRPRLSAPDRAFLGWVRARMLPKG